MLTWIKKSWLLLLVAPAFAAPPYDVTVTFSPPLIGGAPDGYNLYVDDCAVTGPLGAATGSVTSGQTFPALILADGTYQFCVRAFNSAGETDSFIFLQGVEYFNLRDDTYTYMAARSVSGEGNVLVTATKME